tara:strand:+ start:307 stop:495 length:189 start_codon:yes stop_codon:yes gene_type:complete
MLEDDGGGSEASRTLSITPAVALALQKAAKGGAVEQSYAYEYENHFFRKVSEVILRIDRSCG